MRYYIFPTLPKDKNAILNPYLADFGKALSIENFVVNKDNRTRSAIIDLLLNVFSADRYIFNWIENTPYRVFGAVQSLLFILFVLPVLKLRRTTIIWIYHNMTSHEKYNRIAECVRYLMLKHSNVIITHSEEALKFLDGKTAAKTYFFHHPIKSRDDEVSNSEKNTDILIWGAIEPYKGIVEFLSFYSSHTEKDKYKIKIVGKCHSTEYEHEIRKFCCDNILFENRRVSFDELAQMIAQSKYVLFPYLVQSVSSSGALIDTLSYYGTPIGPDRGAFHDLSKVGICLTYSSYEEILNYIKQDTIISKEQIACFISCNTWSAFAKNVHQCSMESN